MEFSAAVHEIDAELATLNERQAKLNQAREVLVELNGDVPATPRRGRPPGSTTPAKPAATPGRRGRPAGGGTRQNQALELVAKAPGIKIPQIAQKMGIEPNYLYRVMPKLAEAGSVTKDDEGGWHAA